MTKKTEKQSSPEEMMAQFGKLWQEKWTAMLHEKGWPKDMMPPTMATMPFVNPFMAPHMHQAPDLTARIAELEARVAKLEKAKKPAKKSKKS
jgi:hypothetical protein